MATEESPEARAQTVVESLCQAGILEATDTGIRFTADYPAKLDEYRTEVETLDDAELVDRITEATGSEEEAETLLRTATDEIVAEYLSLSEVEGLSHTDRLRALASFDSLRGSPLPTDGVPDPFVPVRGDRVRVLADLYELTLIYVWMDDCPPCEIMRSELERTFETPPDDIAMFAVYGPDWKEELHDEYKVDGAPTLLYLIRGNVDVRLRGAYYPETILKEVEKIREIS